MYTVLETSLSLCLALNGLYFARSTNLELSHLLLLCFFGLAFWPELGARLLSFSPPYVVDLFFGPPEDCCDFSGFEVLPFCLISLVSFSFLALLTYISIPNLTCRNSRCKVHAWVSNGHQCRRNIHWIAKFPALWTLYVCYDIDNFSYSQRIEHFQYRFDLSTTCFIDWKITCWRLFSSLGTLSPSWCFSFMGFFQPLPPFLNLQ